MAGPILIRAQEKQIPKEMIPFAPTAIGSAAYAASQAGVPGVGFETPVEDPMDLFSEYLSKYYQNPYVKNDLAALQEAQKQASDAQMQGVSDMRKSLESYRSLPTQFDLSPLMNLVDTWTGSKLSEGYRRPETPQEQLGNFAQIQGGIQKGLAGLADTNRQAVKDRMATFNTIAQLAQNAYLADMRLKGAGVAKKKDPAREARDKVHFGMAFKKEIGDKAVGLAQMVADLDKADRILSRYGGDLPPFDSPDWTQYKSAMASAAILHNRLVGELGALAGGDLALIFKNIGNIEGANGGGWLNAEFQTKFKGTGGARAAMSDTKKVALKKINDLKVSSDAIYGDEIPEIRKKTFDELVPSAIGIYGSGKEKGGYSSEEMDAINSLGK